MACCGPFLSQEPDKTHAETIKTGEQQLSGSAPPGLATGRIVTSKILCYPCQRARLYCAPTSPVVSIVTPCAVGLIQHIKRIGAPNISIGSFPLYACFSQTSWLQALSVCLVRKVAFLTNFCKDAESRRNWKQGLEHFISPCLFPFKCTRAIH